MADKKDMSGVLFQNDKGDNPKRPDYRGEVVISGTTYKLAGWKKADKNGVAYLSLSVSEADKPKEEDKYAPY